MQRMTSVCFEAARGQKDGVERNCQSRERDAKKLRSREAGGAESEDTRRIHATCIYKQHDKGKYGGAP